MDEFISLLDSPELWKSVAFIVSAALLVMPLYRILIRKVRSRAAQISSHIEQALKLRREAEELLKEAQHKSFYKNDERKKIVQDALRQARILKEEANRELEDRLAYKKEEILDRVRLIRQSGLRELKEKVVSIAVDTTSKILKDSEKLSEQDAFMEVGLSELADVLNKEEQKERLLKAALNN